jgi:hypothetical protein
MTLDIQSIVSDPVRLLVFVALLLVVRGLPSLLVYARSLAFRQRAEMTFITATTLPLLVALAEIGQHDGVMLPSNAAALVGAGVVSVLLFPAIATVLSRTGSSGPQVVAEALPMAAAESVSGADENSPSA